MVGEQSLYLIQRRSGETRTKTISDYVQSPTSADISAGSDGLLSRASM